MSRGYRILHLFADWGVEDPWLATVGEVTRVGLDPDPSPWTAEIYAIDLMHGEPPGEDYDLVVSHPDCQPFTDPIVAGQAEPRENQIPRARELGRRFGQDYIIENVPGASGHLIDPVRLNGRMFGLPIKYERLFECSFPVKQPQEPTEHLGATEGPLVGDYDGQGQWIGPIEYWRLAKGVVGDYPSRQVKRSGIPADYLRHLLRCYLRYRDGVPLGEPSRQAQLADGGFVEVADKRGEDQ